MVDIVESYGPWSLVIGASEGLGAAFANEAAAHGLHVVLVARREDILRETAARLEADHGVRTRAIAADLISDAGLEKTIAETSDLEIGQLIVNATHAVPSQFLDADLEDLLAGIRLNCLATTRLVHHFAGLMRPRRRGGVVLVSSIVSLFGTGNLSIYSASKAFQRILGEALWAELRTHGIDALSLVVGDTQTPNLKRSMGEQAYERATPAAVVAESLFRKLESGHGPSEFAMEKDRAIADTLAQRPRAELIERMAKQTQNSVH